MGQIRYREVKSTIESESDWAQH